MNNEKTMIRPGSYEDELRYFGAILHQLCGRPENYDVRRARLKARRTARTMAAPQSAPIVQRTLAQPPKPPEPKPTGLASVIRFTPGAINNTNILQRMATSKRPRPAA